MQLRHYLQFRDFTAAEYAHVFARARWIKDRFKQYEPYLPLQDRTLAMIFEKNSTRTRVSFEAGMLQMRVPVINGLTNEYHPCQILADIFTFIEHRGDIRGKTVAWVGDSNNVCNTWLQAAEVLDFNVHVSTPPGYEVEPERAGLYGTDHYEEFKDPMDAVRGADLVTTDVWTSMGFEAENEERKRDFEDWCVDADMMRAAGKDSLFMHCLPAHRGEEVTAEVIDGPHSVVWDEAENRLHAQKALMEYLLLGKVENT